jgi:spermidine synthase
VGSRKRNDWTHEKLTHRRIIPAIFFISFVTIAWQLALMRCLLIARYHHFSFLIISCALLGFGVGGTVLSLKRRWFDENFNRVFRWGSLCLALALPLCFRLGEMLPMEVFFSPVNLVSTVGWWFAFWFIHGIPFLLAGLLIGLALMMDAKDVHTIYGANLAGSASGSLGGILLLELLPANGAAVPLSLLVVLGSTFVVPKPGNNSFKPYLTCLIAGSLFLAAAGYFGADRVFPLNIDQYKPLAYVQRLEQQGSAKKIATRHGPRGRVELYSSPHFHTLQSLSSSESPPRMDSLIRDGFQAGSVLSIRTDEEARFLLGTLSALPYKLINPENVLIVGATSGLYVWLARLSTARSIVVVQPDKNIIRMLEAHQSKVLSDPRVRVVVTEPRAFLDSNRDAFDIIHLAALEGFAPGSGGIGGLKEDYLATVQGFSKCLDSLSYQGLAAVVRGIQDPARDNIKVAATWIEALEQSDAPCPGDHILMARDELSVVSLAFTSPLRNSVVRQFRKICDASSYDPEWFPGIKPGQTNRLHVLPGPEGSSISWYHHAIMRLLSADREDFYANWIANVRPATDDSPFFHDFFRWESVSKLRQALGPLWPARSEMGFLMLLMAAISTAVVAAVLLPWPMILLRRESDGPSKSMTGLIIAYFGGLGAGFMLLEMSFIQVFTRFLGDPILAAALVLGGFLFFAGVGSMIQPQVTTRLPWGILIVALAIAALVLLSTAVLPPVFHAAAGLSEVWKTVVGLCLIAPLALLLGMPFPWGLSLLHRKKVAAVPLAWSVNGFASVVSTSSAVLVTMTYGFKVLSVLAALIYALAGGLSLIVSSSLRSR